MKLWDVLATCLLLLSSVSTRPLYHNLQSAKRTPIPAYSSDSLSASLEKPEFQPEELGLQDLSMEEQYDITGPYPEQLDDVMDFIEATIGRLRRSSEPDGGSRGRREQSRQRGAANTDRRGAGGGGGGGGGGGNRGRGDKKKGRGRGSSRGGKGGGRGEKAREKEKEKERERERERERTTVQSRSCLLKEVHLNVTDLGLGYRTKEELIFRYCSGPCAEAETNYDKILNNLTHNRKLDKDVPSRTCCRPIAFDDDLSFLDDNVVYHTLKKHSARKCGCV